VLFIKRTFIDISRNRNSVDQERIVVAKYLFVFFKAEPVLTTCPNSLKTTLYHNNIKYCTMVHESIFCAQNKVLKGRYYHPITKCAESESSVIVIKRLGAKPYPCIFDDKNSY